MRKYNVGDKFEIEIAEVFKGAESGNDKYRIKGFDNLVFDDNGLGKMKRTEEAPKVGDIVYSDALNQCGTIIQISEKGVVTVLYSDGKVRCNMDIEDLTQIHDREHIICFDSMFEMLKEITNDYLLKIGE